MAAITDLATAASAGDSDYLVLNQGGTDRKMTRTMLGLTGTGRVATGGYVLTVGGTSAITGSITGGGTIATGGFTATVFATGTIALANVATSFTVSPTVDSVPLKLINTGELINMYLTGGGGALMGQMYAVGLVYYSRDTGNNAAGCTLSLGHNSNATKPGAGFVTLYNRAGSAQRVWVDASGDVRINSSDPIFDNDGAGRVVGPPTSSLDAKNIAGAPLDIADVLAAVRAGADAVRRFTYKSGSYNGEEFSGVVTDFAPRYGMDRDADHPAGKSLSVITVIGDLLLAVANLAERVKALEAG